MPADDEAEPTLRSAEQWLADRGIERHPLVVRTEPSPDEPAVAEPVAEAPPIAEPALPDNVSDDLARAMAYVRNATASTPMSEGRLHDRLADRDHPEAVITLALEQARKERLVDDVAFAAALVEESVARGHAGSRLRDDLRKRGFSHDLIVETLARAASPDPEAAAFAVARDRAEHLGALAPDTAYRRLVAYLARRGHPEGLARKVARQVLWVEREAQQTAGH